MELLELIVATGRAAPSGLKETSEKKVVTIAMLVLGTLSYPAETETRDLSWCHPLGYGPL